MRWSVQDEMEMRIMRVGLLEKLLKLLRLGEMSNEGLDLGVVCLV